MSVSKVLNELTENFARMQNQPLTTFALSTIDWFDGTDKSNTMSWLDQVEVVVEWNKQAPLEVGMAKLKRAPQHNTHKTHDLTWLCLRRLLIENNSDTPYVSDAMVVYNRISSVCNTWCMQRII